MGDGIFRMNRVISGLKLGGLSARDSIENGFGTNAKRTNGEL
jgi:hypothetical protein